MRARLRVIVERAIEDGIDRWLRALYKHEAPEGIEERALRREVDAFDLSGKILGEMDEVLDWDEEEA